MFDLFLYFKITWAVVHVKYKVAKNIVQEDWVRSTVIGCYLHIPF